MNSKDTVEMFSDMITKKVPSTRQKDLGRQKAEIVSELIFLRKGYKSTLPTMRPRLPLLNVQYDP